MKKLGLFLFAVVLSIPLFAQLEKGYVYLKNGTVLKGEYQFDNDKLKVVSAGNIWVFDRAEIDRVLDNQAARKESIAESLDENAVFFRAETGFLAGNADNSQSAPFSFSGTVNYPVTNQFSAGIGAGVEFLKESYLPAFLNLEYKIRAAASAPYLFMMAGYQVPIEESRRVYYDYYPAWSSIWPGPDYNNEPLDARGGFLINPGIGYTQLFSPGFGMSVAFGYRFHRLNYTGENDYELEIDYNRLSVKLGIIFK